MLQVRGEEEKALPEWMIFEERLCMLEGVPSVNDIGDVRINVKAYDSKGNFVADMFIVEVYPLFEKDASTEVSNVLSSVSKIIVDYPGASC